MKTLWFFLPLILTGCAGHGHFVALDEDGWFDLDQGLHYCIANPTVEGTAHPECFKALEFSQKEDGPAWVKRAKK